MAKRNHQHLMNSKTLPPLPINLVLGNFPLGCSFANKLKPREAVNHSSEFLRIQQFGDALPQIDAKGWKCGPFTSNLFNAWWQEWAQYLFYILITPLCQSLDPSFQSETEVNIFL